MTTSKFGRMLTVGAVHFKEGSALTERVGQEEVGGCTALADSAWRVLQLAIERAWSVLDGPFFCPADSAWRILQLAIERA